MLKADLSQWIGRCQTEHGSLSVGSANRLAATINTESTAQLMPGMLAPALSHWCAFTPVSPMGQISSDGHPKLGEFMPPVHLARRMWAGGHLTFHAPIHVGANLLRHTTISAIQEKEGRAGPMVFVTLTHDLFEGDVHVITETQDIVYLQIPDCYTPPRAVPVPTETSFVSACPVNEPMLFRYSAVTFNAHRIHYDAVYAKDVEKYPGLVVHGPLQATLLMQAAINHTRRQPKTFQFRGVHPLFHFDDMHLFGTQTPDGMTLCTGVPGAHQGMQAKITWEDGQ